MAFRGHGRQSLETLARQRQFKDSTAVFPGSAASGAEPESPSAREDWNARAVLWGQLATYANALPSVEGWRLGIRYKSEREGAVGEW